MKPYKAKSLTGAQAMVRLLRRQIVERDELLTRFDHERRLMARLAAETPQFFNPLVVMDAKKIRDRILALPNTAVRVAGHGVPSRAGSQSESREE